MIVTASGGQNATAQHTEYCHQIEEQKDKLTAWGMVLVGPILAACATRFNDTESGNSSEGVQSLTKETTAALKRRLPESRAVTIAHESKLWCRDAFA